MGLFPTGMSCFAPVCVIGRSRVPLPPLRMRAFRSHPLAWTHGRRSSAALPRRRALHALARERTPALEDFLDARGVARARDGLLGLSAPLALHDRYRILCPVGSRQNSLESGAHRSHDGKLALD